MEPDSRAELLAVEANAERDLASEEADPRAAVGLRRVVAPAADGSRLVDVLRACSVLVGIANRDLEAIVAACATVTFRAQDRIFAEGQASGGLWVLAEGRVRLYHADAEGRQRVVSFRGPHASLDLASALDGRPHSVNASALDDCTLVIIPRSMLKTLSLKYPTAVRSVVDELCLELRQRDILTVVASLRGAHSRICCTLLQLARQYGRNICDGVRIDYRLARQDVADRSGVTIETAIRTLSELQRRAIIRTQVQLIDILDLPRLERSSECESCELDCTVFAGSASRLIAFT
jgi:CRP/FNR family cyclic AMP-dependent transcriptional regulator